MGGFLLKDLNIALRFKRLDIAQIGAPDVRCVADLQRFREEGVAGLRHGRVGRVARGINIA